MHADKNKILLDEISQKIIGCAYKVSNSLGNGFVEKVYENALCIDLINAGLELKQQQNLHVLYQNIIVGDFTADIIVNNLIIVELKACKGLDTVHQAQCMNYLKATNLSVCLLINFGNPKVEIRRIVNQF
ncbi:GxxExxY protein [Methylotenera sp. G11]|uniref:GxxExxY protein n=1 Tax=Methylotenera sp. G11 TaxID=1506585 RepID=UPI0006471B37|nr:GxxExxY protein [Methylotenera sp. G11]